MKLVYDVILVWIPSDVCKIFIYLITKVFSVPSAEVVGKNALNVALVV